MGTTLAIVHDDGRIELPPPPRGILARFGFGRRRGVDLEAVERIEKAVQRRMEAAAQRSKVSEALEFIGAYEAGSGVAEPTAVTFSRLRLIANACGVIQAIINRRVAQVSAFCDTPAYRFGQPRSPGFRVKLTFSQQPPDKDDAQHIAELEQFIRETGWCAPPEEECPMSYQPGFDGFLKQFVRDSLTLDHVAVRTWPSAVDPERYPVVSFACIDAGLVRHALPQRRTASGEKVDGYKPIRENGKGQIRFVKLAANGDGITDEFTNDELSVAIRNMRTDELANGYGYSEVEQCIDDIMVWLWAREYNASRFRKDSLPRGMLMLVGDVDDRQMEMFRLQWKQMLQGVENRWAIPMLRAKPQSGANVVWTPFDMSSRDMEYHQFTFAVAILIHSKFGIHPDETGFESLSPFRPPLSQASPENKLKYSQDTGLSPLLRFIQGVINRRIIWRLVPSRRYSFEFVGVGDYDPAADVALWSQMLQAGLTTPREVWKIMDQAIPEAVADHPAWDMPLPFAQGVQLLQNMEQYEQQMEMQKQQAEAQQAGLPVANAGQGRGGDIEVRHGDEGQDTAPGDRLRKGVDWRWL